MTVDKWFDGLSKVVKLVLLFFFSWIVEVLVRLSTYLDKKDTNSLILFVVSIFFGGFLALVDFILIIVKDERFTL